MIARKIRVLVVDDSAFVRGIITSALNSDDAIEVIGNAGDPYEARDQIVRLKPDVMTLDVEMPRMNGLEFLQKLMPQFPLPVVMVSSLTERGQRVTLDALAAGAIDFVTKPSASSNLGMQNMLLELRSKVKVAATANVSHLRRSKESVFRPVVHQSSVSRSNASMIAIGASTGGTDALAQIIRALPAEIPGVVVVQHMPAGFTRLFAERLNELSALEVREARDGDLVLPGHVLIAPGGFQMRVVSRAGRACVEVKEGALVSGHCPSVDVLFDSVAGSNGKNAIGVILTGMGRDGSEGLKRMRDSGARTLGQEESSCIVYGMPKVAWEIGAVERQVSLSAMPEAMMELLRGKAS